MLKVGFEMGVFVGNIGVDTQCYFSKLSFICAQVSDKVGSAYSKQIHVLDGFRPKRHVQSLHTTMNLTSFFFPVLGFPTARVVSSRGF